MIDATLQALVEPRRRKILELVQHQELTATDIASQFDVTRPAISQHLQVLKSAGLVQVRREGTKRFYQARPEGFAALRTYLDQYWSDSLQQLKQVAEAAEQENQ